MNKIEKLTAAQEAKMPEYVDKWINIGLATQDTPPDVETVCGIVEQVYAAGGLEKPTNGVMFFMSPRELVYAHNVLEFSGLPLLQEIQQELSQVDNADRVRVWKEKMGTIDGLPGKLAMPSFIWGQHDTFLSYYDFFINETELTGLDKIKPLIELAKHAHWGVAYDELCLLSTKPIECHIRGGRLHNSTGAAVLYDDGYAIYSLNGVNMAGQEDMIEDPLKLTATAILGVKNVEQRAELIKLKGIEHMFTELNPELMDSDNGYELYKVPVYTDSPRVYLKMNNPSVDEIHLEAVHPDCTSVAQALHWRNFGETNLPETGFEQPIILT